MTSLPPEKQLAHAADAALARQVLEDSTFSVTSSMIGAPTWLRPHSIQEVGRLGSHLNSELSVLDQNLPYTVFPLRNMEDSPIPFECLIEQTGTSLKDTVLLLYVDRFDPENPTQNLVAYNDDIDYPKNTMSAFTSRHGLLLEPKRAYYLVVSTYDQEDLQDTDFALTTSTPNVLFAGAEPVPTMNEWGLLFFTFALAVAGVLHNRRRKAEQG